MSDALARLAEAGVSIWLDDLSRQRLADGSLSRLMREQRVVGVTTNPTIFAKAIAGSDCYDEQIADLASRGVGVDEALRMLTTFDVRWACDVLRPVYEATDGVDGRVSIEVDPRLAHDTARTVAEARALWWLVDRPNMFVKIPAARQGLEAISRCLAGGISVNVTLLFSLDRYDRVVEAFLTGMEHYERAFASDRWRRLEAAGARPQRLLWASTGVKDPAYGDTRYVVDLVAPGVVNTMPEATLNAFADHGSLPAAGIRDTYAEAHQVREELAGLGIDYTDVVQALEDEGVAKFDASWEELAGNLAAGLHAGRT